MIAQVTAPQGLLCCSTGRADERQATHTFWITIIQLSSTWRKAVNICRGADAVVASQLDVHAADAHCWYALYLHGRIDKLALLGVVLWQLSARCLLPTCSRLICALALLLHKVTYFKVKKRVRV